MPSTCSSLSRSCFPRLIGIAALVVAYGCGGSSGESSGDAGSDDSGEAGGAPNDGGADADDAQEAETGGEAGEDAQPQVDGGEPDADADAGSTDGDIPDALRDAALPFDAGPDAALPDAGPHLRRVFLTSAKFDGDLASAGGGASGISGADNLCKELASAANLPGKFRAWISSTLLDAKGDRVKDFAPWYNTHGDLVFDTFASLTTGALAKITFDEGGVAVAAPSAWTGTKADGTKAAAVCLKGGATFGGFDTKAPAVEGEYGDPVSSTKWSAVNASGCNLRKSIYCFEQ